MDCRVIVVSALSLSLRDKDRFREVEALRIKIQRLISESETTLLLICLIVRAVRCERINVQTNIILLLKIDF